jgi:hypothetical protein
MIEIDHVLLSKEALENLIIDIITRQATDYGEHELDIQIKKPNSLKNWFLMTLLLSILPKKTVAILLGVNSI